MNLIRFMNPTRVWFRHRICSPVLLVELFAEQDIAQNVRHQQYGQHFPSAALEDVAWSLRLLTLQHALQLPEALSTPAAVCTAGGTSRRPLSTAVGTKACCL